jgi:hypothetical protein
MNSASFLLLQAVRGPILLMTLGALVLIDYLGIYGFNRTWPLLIITFGVMKLLEQVAKPPAPPPSSMTYPQDDPFPRDNYPPSDYGGPPPGRNAI